MNARFFLPFLKTFFAFICVNSLKMANKSELANGVLEPHPISDAEKKLNLSLCLRPPNNVAKGNLRSCSYRLKRKARGTWKICLFSFTYWAHYRRRHLRLRRCPQDLRLGIRTQHSFSKSACHLFTSYVCYPKFGPEKKFCKETTRAEWIKANCALKILIFRFFTFFLELIFYFVLFIHFISFLRTTFSGTHVRTVRTCR